MKTLFFIALSFCSYSQTIISNEYVVSPASRKVIYVLDDPTGRNIYDSWQKDPYYKGFKPQVILVNDLEPYRKKYLTSKNKNNKS